MRNTFKILFGISIVLLIVSNLYWIYNTIDTAVGQNYYQVSCEEWEKDIKELKKIFPLGYQQSELISFLEQNKIEYEGFVKGKNFIVQFNSFDLTFDYNGELIEKNSR